ncbi:type II secretion system minor pseudopilin GspH [Arhodomonas sp. AD133]|uniref:type II secretion system minor pseudopilin GspH n=1 Tax=Arhodomonas sp. AD133 TaxID=3415009 RepID=UPI003EB959AC
MPRQRGFTLIELLVVLVIVGIVLTLSVLQLREPGERAASEAAERLHARLALAREESVLRGQAVGVAFAADGYRFLLPGEDDAWAPLDNDRALAATELPSQLRLSVTLEDLPATADEDGDDDEGDGEDADEDDNGDRPTVVLYPSGEATPFTATLSAERGGAWIIEGRLNGAFELRRPED